MKARLASLNPELQKNIWIGLSTLKVWLLLGVHLLFYSLSIVSGASEIEVFRAFAAQSAALLVILGIVVASRVTASMREEMRDHTWDWLRLSSLTPTQIVLGKLFGAAALWWIAIIVNGLVYIVSSQRLGLPQSLVYQICLYFGALLMTTGCGILLVNLINRGGIVLVIVLIGLVSTPFSILVERTNYHGVWWGIEVAREDLLACWAPLWGLFFIWLAIRMLRRRMLIESFPIELLALLLLMLLFASGLVLPLASTQRTIFTAAQMMFWMSLVCSFLAAVMVPPSRPHIARLLVRIDRAQRRRFFSDLPGWTVPFCCALISCGICAVTGGATDDSALFFPGVILVNLSALMFCARDIAALHWRAFRVDAEKRDMFIVVAYMALLYGLLPMFAALLFNGSELFIPFANTHTEQVVSVVSLSLQAALVIWLALTAWRSRT